MEDMESSTKSFFGRFFDYVKENPVVSFAGLGAFIGVMSFYSLGFSTTSHRVKLSDLKKVNVDNKLHKNLINWHLPSRNSQFVGNENLLQSLKAYCEDKFFNLIVIVGLAGAGKTELVREFIWRHQKEFNRIYWFSAITRESLIADYLQLGQELEIFSASASVDEKVSILKKWLEEKSGCLLIYDDAPNPDTLNDFLPNVKDGKVLVTSRFSEWGRARVLSVNDWTHKEAREYIQKVIGAKIEDADELASELNYLPLAISMACSYIKSSSITVKEYIKIFQHKVERLIEENIEFLKGSENEVAVVSNTSLISAVRLLFKKIENTSPDCLTLLYLCSQFYWENIPKRILYHCFKEIVVQADLLESSTIISEASEIIQKKKPDIKKFGDIWVDLTEVERVIADNNSFYIADLINLLIYYRLNQKKILVNESVKSTDSELRAVAPLLNPNVITLTSGEQFERLPVLGDGDCSFTAFGITRECAYELILKNINNLRDILIPMIEEVLCTDENFIEYLSDDFENVKKKYRLYRDAFVQQDQVLGERYEKNRPFEKRVGNSAEKLERHGLFLHEKKDSAEKQNEFTRTIPEEFGLGEAKGKGDCFYDSCAQGLNELSGREEYTVKSLRLLCHEYAMVLDKHCNGKPNHPDNWIGASFNDPAKYQQYLANVRYTVEEREAGEGLGNDRAAIWGEQHLDGRIICEKLGIKLHVIEVRENPDEETNKNQIFMVSHNLVGETGLKNLDEKAIDWSDKKTIHIGVCDLHFVPILQKATILPIQRNQACLLEIQKNQKNLKLYAQDLNLLLRYVDYDIRDKRVDAGWAHPLILFALAKIQRVPLRLWELSEQDKVIPHHYYPEYCPEGVEEEFTNLLFVHGNHCERLQKVNLTQLDEHSPVVAYPALKVEDLDRFIFDQIVSQKEEYAFVPLNVAYDENNPKHKNHWVALIIDKKNKLIFYLDPARKTKIPKEVRELKTSLGFESSILTNPIDFQSKEKEEGWIRHSGVYTVEIFKVFEKFIHENKVITGALLPDVTIHKNGVSLEMALSTIPIDEGKSCFRILKDHTRQILELIKTRLSAASKIPGSSSRTLPSRDNFETKNVRRKKIRQLFDDALHTAESFSIISVNKSTVSLHPFVHKLIKSKIAENNQLYLMCSIKAFIKIYPYAKLKVSGISNTTIKDAEFMGVDFSGAVLENVKFKGKTRFKNVDFSKGHLRNVIFSGNIHLEDVDFSHTVLQGVQFDDESNFSDVDFSKAHFKEVRFLGRSNLAGINFNGAELQDVGFDGKSNFSGVDFNNAHFEKVRFFGDSNLVDVNFTGAALEDVQFNDKVNFRFSVNEIASSNFRHKAGYNNKDYGKSENSILNMKKMLRPHLEVLCKNLELQKDDVDKRLFLDMLSLLSDVYNFTGVDGNEHKKLLQRILILQETFSADKFELGIQRTLIDLANVNFSLGNFSDQIAILEKLVKAEQKYLGRNLSRTLANLGNAYGNLRNYSKQVQFLKEALAINVREQGENNSQTALILADLANALGNTEEHQLKKELLQKALHIQRNISEDNVDTALIMANLGNAYGATAEFPRQIESLESALNILEKHGGNVHPKLPAILINLSSAYGALSKTYKQKELLERALIIKETYYGRNNCEFGIILLNLASVYSNLKKFDKQIELLQQAAAIFETVQGSDELLTMCFLDLGTVYGKLNRFEEQSFCFERSIQTQSATYGPLHPKLGITFARIGDSYDEIGEFEKAKYYFDKAFTIYEKLEDHKNILLVEAKSIEVASKLELKKQAFSH